MFQKIIVGTMALVSVTIVFAEQDVITKTGNKEIQAEKAKNDNLKY